VRERPHGAGTGLVVAGRLGERLRGPVLKTVGKQVAAQGLVVHEAVQVRVGDGVGAVGAGDRREVASGAGGIALVRPVRGGRGVRESGGELGEARGHHEGLQGGLVREVLVQRGSLDAEHAGEPPHGESPGAFGVEQGAGGTGDPRLTLVQRPVGAPERVSHG